MKKIVFVDPGIFYEYDGEIYLEERTVYGYSKYIEFLRDKYPEIGVSVVSLFGLVPLEKDSVKKYCKLPHQISDHFSRVTFSEFISGNPDADQRIYYSLLNKNTLRMIPESLNVVYLTEFTRKTKYQAVLSNPSVGILFRFKAYLGSLKEEFLIRKRLKKSKGFQANGDAVWNSYKKLNRNAILFYDHRISEVFFGKNHSKNDVFCVAFSGRLTKVKGSSYLAQISQKLYALDPSIKVYILGDGEDKQTVLEKSAPNVEYKGYMPYKSEWEPFVRENVDLMLLPHVQGDPSMTYFESLGQGVPVVGFKNETLSHLVKKGLGWEVASGDSEALANLIFELSRNPSAVKEKSDNAVKFMSENLYSKVVEKRMEHLVSTLKNI